jgi:hypothetical protein
MDNFTYLELLDEIKEINIVNDIMNNVKEYNDIQKILDRLYNLDIKKNIDINDMTYKVIILDILDNIREKINGLNRDDLILIRLRLKRIKLKYNNIHYIIKKISNLNLKIYNILNKIIK